MRCSRQAFTLVEALLAFGVTVMLMAVLYSLLVSSRRGMVRGEGKLEYIGEANLLFQSLKNDMQALEGEPAWIPGARRLELKIWEITRNPYSSVRRDVSYTLQAGTIHRRVAGLPDSDKSHRRFGQEKAQEWSVTDGELRKKQFRSVSVTFKLEVEPAPTVFTKVFFVRNLQNDKTWVRLPQP